MMNALAPFEGSLFSLPSLFRPLTRIAASGPRMDIAETAEAYRIAVELAGAQKDAIQVSVQENTLTVSAEMPEPQENGEDVEWLLRERAIGRFSRSITLPEAVDDEASEARFTDGVLYLTLKKKNVSSAKRLTIH